ncbi:MAG: 50S ribosomal protein L9 [Candidatus Syntrophosphaera sp.]|jgi:large subunit ribosomal protein L9|nr:50S ribosomal protein L9 [Candidatus Cloacimonadota bacterium]MDY0112014.1 50S ribosomal protein L9 [Candidatus Syntrophosphaera sp.]
MKVILLSSIEKLGNKGDVVNVKRGYARNYLIPRKLAIYATPKNLKNWNSIQIKAAQEEEEVIDKMKRLDEQLRNMTLYFERKTDEQDNLYGSVSEMDICQELAKQGINIKRAMVQMEKHIKSLGENLVKIHLYKDIISELKVVVNKESAEQENIEPEIDSSPQTSADETKNEITTD